MNWLIVDIDGTISDTVWPVGGTDNDILKAIAEADPVLPMLRLVQNFKGPVVFVSNRRARFAKATGDWLARHAVKTVTVLRPETETLAHGEFKEKWIKALTSDDVDGGTVTVVDDDPDGSTEAACRRNGWLHLKPTTSTKQPIVVEGQ